MIGIAKRVEDACGAWTQRQAGAVVCWPALRSSSQPLQAQRWLWLHTPAPACAARPSACGRLQRGSAHPLAVLVRVWLEAVLGGAPGKGVAGQLAKGPCGAAPAWRSWELRREKRAAAERMPRRRDPPCCAACDSCCPICVPRCCPCHVLAARHKQGGTSNTTTGGRHPPSPLGTCCRHASAHSSMLALVLPMPQPTAGMRGQHACEAPSLGATRLASAVGHCCSTNVTQGEGRLHPKRTPPAVLVQHLPVRHMLPRRRDRQGARPSLAPHAARRRACQPVVVRLPLNPDVQVIRLGLVLLPPLICGRGLQAGRLHVRVAVHSGGAADARLEHLLRLAHVLARLLLLLLLLLQCLLLWLVCRKVTICRNPIREARWVE